MHCADHVQALAWEPLGWEAAIEDELNPLGSLAAINKPFCLLSSNQPSSGVSS